MNKQPSSANDFDAADARTEELIREYLKHSGKRIPETAEEVAAVLHLIQSEKIEAPQRLRNCDILACATPAKVFKFPSVSNGTGAEAIQHLRRAAREGKAISQKVEAQMQADRAKVKRENTGEK